MPHDRPHADPSASAPDDTHPGDGSPGIGPRRVVTEPAGLTEAASEPPGANCHPLAGRSGFADAIGPTGEHATQPNVRASSTVHLARAVNGRDGSPAPSPAAAVNGQASSEERPSLRLGRTQRVGTWPLLVLALPAAVAVWSGWVGIGQMTGFGQVHPLPGIWDSLHLDTAVTLPVGVEAYAAYALRAWLSASTTVSARTRRFARWSAIGSLLLGMAGQIAYHLLAQARAAHAPWGITTAVSCLPVLVLGMGAALAHLLRADSHRTNLGGQAKSTHPADQAAGKDTRADRTAIPIRPERLTQAWTTATTLNAAGQRISRRSLRGAGVRGSNAELGALARLVTSQLASQGE